VSRSWQFEHAGRPHSANARLHWTRRAELTREWRDGAMVRARAAKIPALERVHVLVEWLPPDRRRRDPGNLAPAAKAICDGLVDANVIPDDNASRLAGPDLRLGEYRRAPYGSPWVLRVTVTEEAAP
jgi:crossover junction endodeoxyribonuclease RusA